MSALALTETILQLLAQGVQILPSMISAAQTEFALFKSNSAPTPAQQAQIDAALDQAHTALQAAQPAS